MQVNAYLNFNGNCREAMNFYKECLGGELNFQTVEGSPIEKQCPPEIKHQIVHSTLVKNGTLLLMGSDLAREKLADGNTVNLCINCSSDDEIKSFFSSLIKGGKVLEPLAEMFWGGTYGALTDKFGKHWLLNYEKKN